MLSSEEPFTHSFGNKQVFLRGPSSFMTLASCLQKTQKRNKAQISLTDP